jgi:hypothetical protein
VLTHYGFGGPMTFADSKGNTWTGLTDVGLSATTPATQIWWSKPSSVGAGHTVTGSSSGGGYPAVFFAAFSGANASPYDKQSSAAGGSPGSLTPAVADSLLVAALSSDGAGSYAIGSGFTIAQQIPNVGSVNLGGGLAYLIQAGGPSAVGPTWTGAGVMESAMAVFKP